MDFIFYQNCLSIHQVAFLKALAKKRQVTLCVDEEIPEWRSEAGWNVPDFGEINIIVKPNNRQLRDLLISSQTTCHIFSGLDAYPMVSNAFRQSLKKDVFRFIYLEPFRNEGIKGLLRRLKYRWLAYKYDKHIEGVFATGKLGVNCYSSIGFPLQKIVEWGYFVQKPMVGSNNDSNLNSLMRIIFIGSLDERKNIRRLITVLQELPQRFECTLVGKGPLSSEVEKTIANDMRFHLISSVPNREICNLIIQHDILILPSLFDGWGAVVNEALSCGTRVIVSNQCGASTLVVSDKQGTVFNVKKDKELYEAIMLEMEKGKQSVEERKNLRLWAETHISGEIAAGYFEKCCCAFLEKDILPKPVWLK